MCVGKKAAGKKNKFWVGRFSFIQFALEENLIFVTALGALHITFRGFARAGLFCLLVVNITKFSIKTKRDEETFSPRSCETLVELNLR